MAEKKPTKAHPPKRRQHRRLTETHRDSPRLTETHRDSTEAPPRGATETHRDSPRLTETYRDCLGPSRWVFLFLLLFLGLAGFFVVICQRFWPYLSLFGSFGFEVRMFLSFEAVISAETSGTMVFCSCPVRFGTFWQGLSSNPNISQLFC